MLINHYIFFNKVINRINFIINQLWRLIPLKIMIALIYTPYKKKSYDFIKNKLNYILGDFSRYIYFVDKNISEKQNVLKWAEYTIKHKFDYLGSGLITVNPIDWHSDFKSGFKWEKGKFYKDYKLVNISNNADIKIPWELSRCHHLLWIGQAYLITKDEKFANEVVDEIQNWIKENPLMYSINWTCTMDVSIRAINWMYAVNMISSSNYVSNNFFLVFYKSLFEHGFYIFNNLEKTFPYSTNHYAADLIGLLFIGQLFLSNSIGKKWYNYALCEYFREVRTQILPSGCHFEKSISYHRLMTEIFSYSYYMLLRIEERIPVDIQYRVKSMYDFIFSYIKPNGLSPNIGDNDDGRFLPFVKRDFRDHKYLLSIAKKAFDNFGFLDQLFTLDIFFLFPNEDKTNNLLYKSNSSTYKSNLFSDAGFCILDTNGCYIFFSNSGLSGYPSYQKNKVIGTHNHSDLLSFELNINGEDIVIDPGTYVYSSNIYKRNKYRSTISHNTIIIDNNEQYSFCKNNIFFVNEYAYPYGLKYAENEIYKEVEGYYKKNNLLHVRNIFNFKSDNLCKIKDSIKYEGMHTFKQTFHFNKNYFFEIIDNKLLVTTDKSCIKFIFNSNISFSISLFNDTISYSYGTELYSKTLLINGTFIDKFHMELLIKW